MLYSLTAVFNVQGHSTSIFGKRSPRISGAFFLAEIFEKVSFDPDHIIFGSLDFQLGNANR